MCQGPSGRPVAGQASAGALARPRQAVERGRATPGGCRKGLGRLQAGLVQAPGVPGESERHLEGLAGQRAEGSGALRWLLSGVRVGGTSPPPWHGALAVQSSPSLRALASPWCGWLFSGPESRSGLGGQHWLQAYVARVLSGVTSLAVFLSVCLSVLMGAARRSV